MEPPLGDCGACYRPYDRDNCRDRFPLERADAQPAGISRSSREEEEGEPELPRWPAASTAPAVAVEQIWWSWRSFENSRHARCLTHSIRSHRILRTDFACKIIPPPVVGVEVT